MSDVKFIEIKEKRDCTGCRACEQICPKKAITMIEDDEGFIVPKIDKQKCINCGLCKRTCPQINNIDTSKNKVSIYAVKSKEKDIAKKSTSAGIAYLISKKIIEEKGIVVGCAHDENLIANHICVDNLEDLKKLRGSKYVISNTKDTFTKIKKYLQEERKVLFTGTPCQVAGLKQFLKKDYDNLITIDIVCHGVPSKKIFRKYLDWIEQKLGDKIKGYSFRDKQKVGWGLGFCAKISTENKTVYKKADFDPYYNAFLKGMIYRECCYSCKYANTNRVGDITLADFWGIEKYDKKFYDGNGVSLVFVNNDKANKIINNLKQFIELKASTIEKASRYNLNLVQPTKRPEVRNYVYKDLENMSFEKVIKKDLLKINMKAIIKNCIPQKLKLLYKKYKN